MARMIIKLIQALFLIVSAVLLAGCLGTEPKTVRIPLLSATLTLSDVAQGAETLAATVTAIPLPSRTLEPPYTPEPTRTPVPSRTPTAVPMAGPDLSFLFLRNGAILRYKLQTWSEESLAVPVSGTVDLAAISPDGQWLAFYDEEGVEVARKPFEDVHHIGNTRPEWSIGLAFNFSADLLAYADGVGLNVYNLYTGKDKLIVYHELSLTGENLDEDKLLYDEFHNGNYFPEVWSPDDQWLIFNYLREEYLNLKLINWQSLNIYEFTDCYSDVKWRSDSQSFIVSVIYSEMAAREEKDGIYVVSVGDKQVTEQRIYYDDSVPVTHRDSSNPDWNPSGDWISFIQSNYALDTNRLSDSRLMLMRADGSQLRELASSSYGIDTPIWAAGGNILFYVVKGEARKIIRIDLDTGEQREYELPGNKNAELVSLSSDDRWLLINGYFQADKGYTTYLVNTESGNGILLGEMDEFIGWER